MQLYLISDGGMGQVPEDYLLIKAAKWLGVAPWELENQHSRWFYDALEFMAAERYAEKPPPDALPPGFGG